MTLAQRAAILAETLPGASGFLSAIPSKTLGLAMEPAEFRIEVLRRLTMPVYSEDSYCPLCDAVLDKFGFHALVCTCGGDKVLTHNAARNHLGRYCSTAGLGSELERPGLLPPRPDWPSDTGLRRPADVYIPMWSFGTPVALDLAITSPQRQSSIRTASLQAGSAARWYEDFKRNYQDTEAQCLAHGVAFLPLVAESSGGWGSSAMKCFRRLAKMTSHNDVDAAASLGALLQGLSVTMRTFAARAVLKRASTSGPRPSAGQIAAQGIMAAAD